LHHNNAPSNISFFHQWIFWPKTTWSSSLTHSTFLFSWLNNLTEHDSQDTLKKKWQQHWEQCIRAEGDYFEGDGGQ
jgi:hypothetical protein